MDIKIQSWREISRDRESRITRKPQQQAKQLKRGAGLLTFLWLSTGSGILRLGTRMARRPTRSGSSMTSRSGEPSSPSPATDDWWELEVEPLRRWNKRRKPSTIVPPPPILLALRAPRHWLPTRPPSYVLRASKLSPTSSAAAVTRCCSGRLLAPHGVLLPLKGRRSRRHRGGLD